MRSDLLVKALVSVLGLGLVLGLTPRAAYPLHYPHNQVNGISCSSCHFEHGGQPGFMPPWTEHEPQNIDDTPYNTLCWSCHNDIEAPYVRTHSSLTTDDKYGDWTVECKACHDPHRQMQFLTYGDASFLYSGESTSVTPTSISRTDARWSINQYQGLVVVPNTSEVYYNYKILSNTEDTLNVQGPMDLNKAAVGDTFAIIYGKLIESTLPAPQRDACEVVDNQYVCAQTIYRMVRFFNDTGPNSFADGDTEYDGVCEVCHTQTTHFQYSGGGSDQLHDNVGGAAGQDCIDCHAHINGFGHGGGAGAGCESCHGHDAGYEYEPGKFSEGRGTFKSHSTHTENDSDDLRGPNVACDTCHDPANFPYFKSGADSNGDGQYELSETDVCDVCHSPGGAFDGVNDAGYGARNNWADGVYEDDDLKAGTGKWCASCHDGGTSVAQGVQAPNVAGDDTTWGYYATGHGRNQIVACLDCHDSTAAHIDGEPRTYSVASDNYQAGHRLASVGGQAPMRVPINYLPPQDGRQQPEDYRLCFSCHNQYQVLGDIGRSGTSGDWLLSSWGTNFREEEGVSPLTDVQNGHYVHVGQPGPGGPARSWDSDWDGAVDSAPSCPACHNVHGSPSSAMMRHGELISTPGTGDKIPALDFRWYEADGSTVTTNLAASRWGQVPPMEDPGPTHIGQSYVCDSCHGGPNSTRYYREPVEGTTGTCVGCHSTVQDNGDGNPPGGRRAVVDEFGSTSHHVQGQVDSNDCLTCHAEAGTHMDGVLQLADVDGGGVYTETTPLGFRAENITLADSKTLASFCLNCHDGDGAGGDTTPFSDGQTVPAIDSTAWGNSVHDTGGTYNTGYGCLGDGSTTGCHATGHGSENIKILNAGAGVALQTFCYNCHTQDRVMNDALASNRPGGYVSADDIEEAFGKSEKHDLGTTFTIGSDSFSIECTSCHNPHVVTGRYWDAENGVSPVTRPDFSDPVNNPRAMGTVLWGDEPGEKMDDFAARASGTGGWYYKTAQGYPLGSTGLPFDQPAIYRPPKSGSGYESEFGGDVLPDYTTLCLDCHTYRMSDANPPVNWGQGIACTDNSVDPPDQRIECGAQHGLNAAGKPWYVSDEGTAGFWGSSGNPDVIFDMNYVTRGRHNGHFMRWPYDSADRSAGINFVLSCTDCHEAHGSNRGGMVRERFNVNANGDCGTGGDSSPNGENCTDGGNWNSFCNACHYYYGGQHEGMSCGNASCHEANSPHRIIHTVDSGAGTQLMLTAAGYEGDYQRPDFTPDITYIEAQAGSNELVVTFREGAYTNADLTGALEPGDFWLFDTNNDNPRTITNVTHTAGEAIAAITMSAPLTQADLRADTLAARPASIWSWYEGGYENSATGTIPAQAVSAGPWPVKMPTCLAGTASFQFNESAGSSTVADDQGFYVGTVSDPNESLSGDGYFHGDGTDNYLAFDNDSACLQSATSMTLEARVKPGEMASGRPDKGDDCSGGVCNTIQRIFARDSNQNFQLSLWRNVSGDPWDPVYNPPDGVGSFAFWVPAYPQPEGEKWWKPVLTDYDACPIRADHWYRIKMVWNSAKTGGIPGDIFVDDQGPNGDDMGETWGPSTGDSNYKNCTDSDQSQLPPDRYIHEGDTIRTGDGGFAIGVNVNNHAKNLLDGLIDWISWKAEVDYSGVDDPPNPPQ